MVPRGFVLRSFPFERGSQHLSCSRGSQRYPNGGHHVGGPTAVRLFAAAAWDRSLSAASWREAAPAKAGGDPPLPRARPNGCADAHCAAGRLPALARDRTSPGRSGRGSHAAAGAAIVAAILTIAAVLKTPPQWHAYLGDVYTHRSSRQAYEIVQGALVRFTSGDAKPPPTAVLLHGILGRRQGCNSPMRCSPR